MFFLITFRQSTNPGQILNSFHWINAWMIKEDFQKPDVLKVGLWESKRALEKFGRFGPAFFEPFRRPRGDGGCDEGCSRSI